MENGYEWWDSIIISQSYYDLRNISLDELISGWNELTVKLGKDAKQKQEYEEKVKELEMKKKTK